ncbi:MAG TPA: MFS transporter [Mucilaginibacter sp.]|jgi:ACS family hexuronate transporter-like MFS transporter
MKSRYRYTILGLLFLAMVINYIDRQIIGLLKPMLEKEFKWTEQDYGNLVFWFQVMYAIGYVLSGRFVDKVGAKIGYGLAVLFWSIAALAHAFMRSTFGFTIARSALGFTEAGSFPAAMKSVTEWFPVNERSFASGMMISGTTIGPILAPGIVLWLANHYNWQISFIVTGALGLIWVVAWYLMYSKPVESKKVDPEELAIINADNTGISDVSDNEKVPLLRLLNKKATWGFFIATFLTDPVWWFYLFWLPSYLTSNGMTRTELAYPLTVVYALAAGLSIAGGWLSSFFVKIGWTINSSRKVPMLICVGLALPVVLIRFSHDVWLSVGIIAVAAAAQTIWKGVLLTTVADQFPKKTVSSVIGIGGMGGAIGGMLAAKVVGILLDAYKAGGHLTAGYNLIFICCGLAYVLAIAMFHFLSPKLEQVKI